MFCKMANAYLVKKAAIEEKVKNCVIIVNSPSFCCSKFIFFFTKGEHLNNFHDAIFQGISINGY